MRKLTVLAAAMACVVGAGQAQAAQVVLVGQGVLDTLHYVSGNNLVTVSVNVPVYFSIGYDPDNGTPAGSGMGLRLASVIITSAPQFVSDSGRYEYNYGSVAGSADQLSVSDFDARSYTLSFVANLLSDAAVNLQGDISLDPSGNNTINLGGKFYDYDGRLTFLTNSAVPEPAGWALLMVGLAAVGERIRRRTILRPAQKMK